MLIASDDKNVANEDGVIYIYRGKTRFKITEHFKEYGKTPAQLITELLIRNIDKIAN